MTTADVIIIGGGPAGAGAAWALERAAPGIKTVLIEKADQLAAGASNASLENFRTCWPAPCLAGLMARSYEVFTHPDEYLNVPTLGVKQQGYLFCGFDDKDAQRLRGEVDHLHSIGLTHVEYLDADEVAYRFPWLSNRVIAAKFDPKAGWLDSHALVYALARSALNLKIMTGVKDVAIKVENGCVVGVETPDGFIASPRVLIAAGPDSRRIGRTAGFDIPVIVRPRQSFTTHGRHKEFPSDAPMLIGTYPFPHVRPEAQDGTILGWEYEWVDKKTGKNHLTEPEYPIFKDQRFPSMVLLLLARQFGHADGEGFASSVYMRGLDHRAGYYVYRDPATTYYENGNRHSYNSQRAIIDAVPSVEGLFLSVAHVGHGIMSAPAAGEIAAAHVLGQALPDPVYAQFGLDVPYVEHDSGGISGHA